VAGRGEQAWSRVTGSKDALLAGVVVRFCYVSSANAIMIFDFPVSGVVRDDIGLLATKKKCELLAPSYPH